MGARSNCRFIERMEKVIFWGHDPSFSSPLDCGRLRGARERESQWSSGCHKLLEEDVKVRMTASVTISINRERQRVVQAVSRLFVLRLAGR